MCAKVILLVVKLLPSKTVFLINLVEMLNEKKIKKKFVSKFIKIIFKVILYINIFINKKLLWDYWINWALELQYIFLFLKQKTTKIVVQVAVSGRSFTITSVTVIHFLNGFAAGGKKKKTKQNMF